MRVAVFSDVHGNAVALQAVIASARAAGVDAFWVVGDLVANGPQPAEALELFAVVAEPDGSAGQHRPIRADGRSSRHDPSH